MLDLLRRTLAAHEIPDAVAAAVLDAVARGSRVRWLQHDPGMVVLDAPDVASLHRALAAVGFAWSDTFRALVWDA